ncbi:hypothetical protein Tco_0844166 [Tanacetum coccineum]
MSDSDESGVTYIEISSPFEGLSDIGSLGVIGTEYEGLPWMLDNPYVQVALQAPPSPDYIPGPEEPQSPPLPDFVPELIYPEYIPQEDEVFLAEEQPLPAAASPTTQSPDYVPKSDPEAVPKEDDDKDPEEDPVDYPADKGDDDDDEDEPSDDVEDEEVDIKADNKEEEEHPTPADFIVVALPAADQAPSAEETEPFETEESTATPPPHPTYRITARISILALVPTPVWSDVEVARLLAISTPPSLPISPWSSPLPQIPSTPLPQIPSPPLLVSSPVPVLSPSLPASPICSLGYQAIMIREDRPEVTLPPRKRLGIALSPRYEIRESSSAAAARPTGGLRADYGFVATIDREIKYDLERDVGYGITDSWDEIVEAMQGTLVVTDVVELSQRMTEFKTRVKQDTDKVYMRLDDEQSGRQLLAGQLNMLFRDRRAHAHTARLMETEAKMSREAWGRSMDASDLARQTVRDAGGRSQEVEAAHRGTEVDKETLDSDERVQETAGTGQRTTRLNPETTPAATAATTTTSVTNAQLQAMINQGVTVALAAHDANTNGVDNHNSRTRARRN